MKACQKTAVKNYRSDQCTGHSKRISGQPQRKSGHPQRKSGQSQRKSRIPQRKSDQPQRKSRIPQRKSGQPQRKSFHVSSLTASKTNTVKAVDRRVGQRRGCVKTGSRHKLSETERIATERACNLRQRKKLKLTEADRIEEVIFDKRRKAVERKRRQRMRIKLDPDLDKLHRKKRRSEYKKRKDEGILKSVSQMSKHEQAKQPAKWRLNSKRLFDKKRLANCAHDLNDNVVNTEVPTGDERMKSILCKQTEIRKKKARANRQKLERKCLKLTNEFQRSNILLKRWKKRYERAQKVDKGSPTPKKLVRNVLKCGKEEITRRLLFGEVLKKQSRQNYSSCSSAREKQVHAKVVSSWFLKKYKLGFVARRFISPFLQKKFRQRKSLAYERKNQSNALGVQVVTDVTTFLEEDINSSSAPGK